MKTKPFSSRCEAHKEISLPAESSNRIYDQLFSTLKMASIFSDAAFLAAMLRFEAALGAALEHMGIAPPGTNKIIASVDLTLLDYAELARRARLDGNLCIPFIRAVTAAVYKTDNAVAGFVHYGATSQDAQDTATMLQCREGWSVLERDLEALCSSLAALASQHEATILPGRTWLQQGPPVTLGFKIAGWLAALQDHRIRMKEVRGRAFTLQFGGAVGTLAALGEDGPKIARFMAGELDLFLPPIPWHTQRDRIAELATTLGLLTGTLGKIGRDISLLMQTEVSEWHELGEGGGSSTMPHKRNPVSPTIMISAALRTPSLVATMLMAMVQEHERGLGGWHAEWETLPEVFRLAAGALDAGLTLARAVQTDAAAMQENLQILRGAAMAEALVFAASAKLGKQRAREIIGACSRHAIEEKKPLLSVALEDEHLREMFSAQELEKILNPAGYLGSSSLWLENVLRLGGQHARY